jgi:hypothetical protein
LLLPKIQALLVVLLNQTLMDFVGLPGQQSIYLDEKINKTIVCDIGHFKHHPSKTFFFSPLFSQLHHSKNQL